MKALEIDSSLAEAHTSLSGVKLHFEWDLFGSEREIKRALEINPNYATAHHWYAFNLSVQGRFDEAIAELKRALEIDPLSPFISRTLGATLFRARKYDLAIQQLSKALELEPNDSRTHYLLGSSYEQKQMSKEAFAEYLSGLSAEQPETLNQFKKAFAVSGMKGYWERYLDLMKREMRQRYVPAYHIAEIYARLGDKEQALEWLSRAYDERSYPLVYVCVDPWFDNIRSEPRFTALVNKMGLGSSEGVVRK